MIFARYVCKLYGRRASAFFPRAQWTTKCESRASCSNLFAGRSMWALSSAVSGGVNTAKFPEEFRSRENLGDLRGMHLRRYVGNVTSRRRRRIYYNGCQTFPFCRSTAGSANMALSETRARFAAGRAGLSDVPGLSSEWFSRALYVPRNLSSAPNRVSHFIRGSREPAGSLSEFQTVHPAGVCAFIWLRPPANNMIAYYAVCNDVINRRFVP